MLGPDKAASASGGRPRPADDFRRAQQGVVFDAFCDGDDRDVYGDATARRRQTFRMYWVGTAERMSVQPAKHSASLAVRRMFRGQFYAGQELLIFAALHEAVDGIFEDAPEGDIVAALVEEDGADGGHCPVADDRYAFSHGGNLQFDVAVPLGDCR